MVERFAGHVYISSGNRGRLLLFCFVYLMIYWPLQYCKRLTLHSRAVGGGNALFNIGCNIPLKLIEEEESAPIDIWRQSILYSLWKMSLECSQQGQVVCHLAFIKAKFLCTSRLSVYGQSCRMKNRRFPRSFSKMSNSTWSGTLIKR